MNDNNNKLAVVKLAIETITPATEKLGLRFCEVIEKSDATFGAIVQAETSARYAAISSGSEGNVGAMLSNEKELGLAAFSLLDKLFSKGIALAEKGLELKAMKAAAQAPLVEMQAKAGLMAAELKSKEIELAMKKLELKEQDQEHALELRKQELREKQHDLDLAKHVHNAQALKHQLDETDRRQAAEANGKSWLRDGSAG